MAGIPVVVVDDHRMTAFSLKDSLESRGIVVSAIEHTATAGMEAVEEKPCEVLVTDLDLGPGPSGLHLALQTTRAHENLGVVILTPYEDPKLFEPTVGPMPQEFVYVLKQQLSQIDDLIASIELARDYATGAKTPSGKQTFPLTSSQAHILRLVARGMSNQAIGQELHLSADSVATTLKRLARKLGITRTTDSNVRVLLTQKFFHHIGYTGDH